VLRLAMMLAVTLMLINQARRPELYERFFAAAGAPLTAEPNQTPPAAPGPPTTPGTPSATPPNDRPPASGPVTGQLSQSPEQAVWYERWEMLTQPLSTAKRRQLLPPLAGLWFGLPLEENPPSTPSVLTTTEQVGQWLEELAAASSPTPASVTPEVPPPTALWQQMTTLLRTAEWDIIAGTANEPAAWRLKVPLQAAKWPESFRIATNHFLDEQLLRIVQEPSPWLPSQRLSYLRGVQRVQLAQLTGSADLSPKTITAWTIEPSQLLVHFAQLAGHAVRLRGRIGAITQALPTPLTPAGYPIIWLAQPGENPQPAAVHLIPPPASGSGTESSINAVTPLAPPQLQVGESIEVVGLVFKPLSYRSQSGPNVATVVLASNWTAAGDAPRESPRPALEQTAATDKGVDSGGVPWLPAEGPGGQSPPPPAIELVQRLLSEPLRSALAAATDWVGVLHTPARERPRPPPRPDASLLRAISQLERIPQLGTGTRSSPDQWPHLPLDASWQLQSWEGWTVDIEPLPVPHEARSWWPTSQLYLLKLANGLNSSSPGEERSPPADSVGWALVSQVPKEWLAGTLHQPVVLWGAIPLPPPPKTLDQTDSASVRPLSPPPLMLVGHIQWRLSARSDPQAPVAYDRPLSPSLPFSWSWLLEKNIDLMLVNQLRRAGHSALSAGEADAFYSLLHLTNTAGDELVEVDPRDVVSLSDILAAPDRHVLKRTRFTLRSLRSREVPITDPWLQTQLGGDRYFEIQGLADLGDLRVEYQPPDGATPIAFDGRFPVTIVSRQLPSWMLDRRASAAELSNAGFGPQDLEVSGIFYRLWSYRRAAEADSRGDAGTIVQISPLVVATELRPPRAGWQDSPTTEQRLQWIPLSLLIVVAIGLAIAAWTSRWKANPLKSR
jgi:hypothetical protein